jgi:hypothetical protein
VKPPFVLYFRETGGLVPVDHYVLIVGAELVHVNLGNESISRKPLKDGETKSLRDAIKDSGFFDIVETVEEVVANDARFYVLTVTEPSIDPHTPSKSNTVAWNDSTLVGNLNNLVPEIKKLLDNK